MGSCNSQHAQTAATPREPETLNRKIKSGGKVHPSNSTLIRVSSADKMKSPQDNEDSAVASRNSSAVSSTSAKTTDSGMEDSDKKKEGETNSTLFTTRGPSGKMRSVDEAEIIEKLRTEGLITRPKSVASGMSFEIGASQEPTKTRRLPPRLQRLEPVKKSLTEEEIQQKLARAAERRKRKQEAALRPPRPPTRSGMTPAPTEPEAAEIPFVRMNHPETEVLRPPTTFEALSTNDEAN